MAYTDGREPSDTDCYANPGTLANAVTRRGETLGVYVPTRRKRPKTAHMSELKEAADRLASALADADEEELVADFKELRRRGKGAPR
jgi:hypothetical protein